MADTLHPPVTDDDTWFDTVAISLLGVDTLGPLADPLLRRTVDVDGVASHVLYNAPICTQTGVVNFMTVLHSQKPLL